MSNKDNYIEYVPRISKDKNIKCYYCDSCHSIFTYRNGDGFEYCPQCNNLSDRIPKWMYNLMKWERIQRAKITRWYMSDK